MSVLVSDTATRTAEQLLQEEFCSHDVDKAKYEPDSPAPTKYAQELCDADLCS